MRIYGTSFALFFCALLTFSCQSTRQEKGESGNAQAGRWLSFQEKEALALRQLYAEAGVHTLQVRRYMEGEGGTKTYLRQEASYRPDGRLVAETKYLEDGNLDEQTDNRWMDTLLTRQKVVRTRGTSFQADYAYDDQQQRIAEIILDTSGDTLVTRQFSYDAQGREASASFADRSRGIALKRLTEYDQLNRPVRITETSAASAQPRSVESYVYTEQAWQTFKTNAAGDTIALYDLKLNAEGQPLEIVNQSPDGKIRMKMEYLYTPSGTKSLEITRNSIGQKTMEVRYRYLQNGLLEERTTVVYGPGERIVETIRDQFEYSYFPK